MLNQGSEDKNNKSPGDDEVVIKSVNNGGFSLLKALNILFNECILKGTRSLKWNNATQEGRHS